MDNDKDKQQKPGPMSKGINTVNRAQSTLKWAKRAKKAYQIASTAGEAIGTAPVWIVPVTVGVVCVIVLVVIFGVITPGTTVGGNLPGPSSEGIVPGSSGGPSSTPGVPPSCTSGNIAACLKTDFNITVTNGTTAQLTDIYNIFSLPFSYPTYKQFIGSSPLNIVLLSDSNGCHGYTPSGAVIDIYNFSYCQSLPFKNRQYLLIHESGHVISFRTRLLQSYVSNAWEQDPSCYESGFLKTYPLRSGVNDKQESFAESIADYVMCSGGGTCQYAGAGNGSSQPINNFPSSCPVTNAWVGLNIF